jgi:predicted nucleic acid-binding Zn ribbon protein
MNGSKVTLRNYTRPSIEAAAQELVELYQLGAIDAHALGNRASRLVLRDQLGAYWAYHAQQRRWLRSEGEGWLEAGQAPERLEGPADLPVDLPPARDDEPVSPPSRSEERLSAAQLLERINHRILESYLSGELTSLDAEEVMAEHLLVDQQGRLWTSGAHSGRWYAFSDGAWKLAGPPPSDPELVELVQPGENCLHCGQRLEDQAVCPSCGEFAAPRLGLQGGQALENLSVYFRAAAGSLPEGISDPWEPPEWYPAAVLADGLVCPGCGHENPAASNFCNRCGETLASLRLEAPAEDPAPAEVMKKHCANCGAPAQPGKKFCTQCGAALKG